MAANETREVAGCIFEIPDGMFPGRILRVQGNTPANAQSFQLNIQNGADVEHSDIVLSLDFKFPGSVVMSHRKGDKKGADEIKKTNPLEAGKDFEVLVLCEKDIFKIALNGQHFHEFRHRIPFDKVTHGVVLNDMNLTKVIIGNPVTVNADEPLPPGVGPPPDLPPGYGPAPPGQGPPPPPPPGQGTSQAPAQGSQPPAKGAPVKTAPAAKKK